MVYQDYISAGKYDSSRYYDENYQIGTKNGEELFHVLVLPDHAKIQIEFCKIGAFCEFLSRLCPPKNVLCLKVVGCLL